MRTDQDKSSIIISADSHVSEPGDLWVTRVPSKYRNDAPRFDGRRSGEGFGYPGGTDPNERIKEMETDGVSAEVLYPTLGLKLFGLDDAALQEECFRVYNDWLLEYCQVAPNRLIGVPAISVYEVDHGIKELERCLKGGLKGALVWQAPHSELPLYSNHYDRLWAAAQDMAVPVSLHILTGHNYSKNRNEAAPENYRGSVNFKLFDAVNALFDFIFHGVLERFPRLKVVIVENEIGWIPFLLQQWDYYYRRFLNVKPVAAITMEPSRYFYRQVYATFFNDAVGAHNFLRWGVDNYMWSNDFPHGNTTWPHSREVIQRDLGHLPEEMREKLLCTTVANLYDIEIPERVKN
jgi:predicted TIM-barrel fold metal-dependent hydrolase